MQGEEDMNEAGTQWPMRFLAVEGMSVLLSMVECFAVVLMNTIFHQCISHSAPVAHFPIPRHSRRVWSFLSTANLISCCLLHSPTMAIWKVSLITHTTELSVLTSAHAHRLITGSLVYCQTDYSRRASDSAI